MEDDKKKTLDEEKKDEKSENAGQEQKEDPPKDDKSEEKPSDSKQADENGEDAPAEETPKEEPKAQDKAEEKKDETVTDAPQTSETDKLKAENLTLKTQLEAMRLGFSPDCMDDAVTLAEAIVKRDGTDISAALSAVAKKYPDWKSESKKTGFKVGADSSEKTSKTDESRLSAAFGLKKSRKD